MTVSTVGHWDVDDKHANGVTKKKQQENRTTTYRPKG